MRRCRVQLNRKGPLNQRLRSALVACLAVAAGLLALPASRAAESAMPGEYELKAAVVAKLPAFVIWPATTPPSDPAATNTIVIGVVGRDPFGPHLQNASQRVVAAGGRRVRVRACATVAEALQCQVVFIASSEKAQLAGWLAGLRGAPVLTVSDLEGFGEAGGMVALASTNRRVTLQVNLAETRAVELRVDPQLLQLAKAVNTARPRK